jgi:hypothetical protein
VAKKQELNVAIAIAIQPEHDQADNENAGSRRRK